MKDLSFNLCIKFPNFFHWKAIQEKKCRESLGLLIKINFFIIFNFSIRRNIICSRMNIIFFSDIGNVIFKFILLKEDHLCFFDGNVISYL